MKYRHFGKNNQKRALLRGLVLNVFKTGGIETFRTRGKDAQKLIDKIINLGKIGDINSKRRISKLLATKREIIAQIEKVAQNFKDRSSGYTRIIRLGQRKGDASQMVRLEWVVEIKKEIKVLKLKKDTNKEIINVQEVRAETKKVVKKKTTSSK